MPSLYFSKQKGWSDNAVPISTVKPEWVTLTGKFIDAKWHVITSSVRHVTLWRSAAYRAVRSNDMLNVGLSNA